MGLTRPKYSQIYDTDWKQSVRLATTADVGNLFLANLQPSTVDSVTVNVNDRILVKDQTRPFENGIYIVRSVGTGSNGWWTRTLDAAQSSFVTSGLSAVASEGASNAGQEFRLVTPDPITLDTTNLSFIRITGIPGGANTQVQFADGTLLGGSPGFTFNKNSNAVVITGNITVNGITANTLDVAGGGLNSVAIGQSTPAAGAFTSLTASDKVYANSSLNSTSTSTGALVVAGGIGIAGNVYAPTFYGNLGGGSVLSNIYLTGSLVPSANVTYDLGSPTQKFRSAYFSGNTVYIGSESISVAANGTWTFTSAGANVNLGANAVFNPPSANISGNLTVSGAIVANNTSGILGYVLSSTGNGIEWIQPSAGSVINNGTSNVSILGSSADVVTTIGGNIITRTSAQEFAVTGNLTVSGNLFVNGNVTTINANNLNINDSLIFMADFNPADTLDIGFVSSFTPGGGSYQHTGFVRDASDGVWKLFAGVASEPTTTVDFTNASYSTIRVGNIYAGGTTANDNRFLQSTAGGLAWTAATSISSGVTSATADATSILVIANGVNSARFYGDIVYVYQDLELSANILVNGVGDFLGNVSAPYFVGDGSQLTGLPEGYSNVNVSTYFASGTATGNIIIGNIITTGSGQFSGPFNENTTTAGVFVGNLNTTPRIGFFNGNTAQNWQIDNSDGTLRWYTPGVVRMSLSPTGTLTVGNILPTANNVSNIGSSSSKFRIIHAQATQAQYADLAEVYTSDQQYSAGTVVVFGGEAEVTQSRASHDTRIAGVVSTNPAYLMNSTETGVPVALQGRVPCRVLGPVNKGDRMVSSHIAGVAQALDLLQYQPGCIIGKALQAIDSTDIVTIEVVVGRV